MRLLRNRWAASLGVIALCMTPAVPAFADNFGNRVTVDIAPNLQLSGTGDAAARAPVGLTAVGATNDHPFADTTQLDYGIDIDLDKKSHLYYTHSALAFNIGRVLTLAPGTSFTFGTFYDRFDTVGVNRDLGHGLLGRLYYYDHERMDVTGLCNDQTNCPNKAGVQSPNPAAIDEHGYGVGANYNFGPKTRIGPLFTASIDAKYVPRPSFAPPGAPCGSCEGLGHYVGSQFIVPYSLQMKLPFSRTPTFIPFVAAGRDVSLYRDEATPESYNTTTFGFVKVINKNLSLTTVDINYQGCRCSDTVPAPDNVRLSVILVKLDIKTKL